ncbi:hypothetical protein ACLB2K_065983 [Fragaria x ananassa]
MGRSRVQMFLKRIRVGRERGWRGGGRGGVLDGQEERVEDLVKLVSLEELKLQNLRGNTPLHFAAAQGNVRMCKCIAKDRSLVDILNKDKETPLFLAALYGKKDAFLCLHYIRTPNKADPEYYSYCRREDGDTILHCAISGEYFDLAFQIIALYKDVVNYVNKDGFSPLHLMASQPSAFRSGSHLSHWNRIIYNCILVDELNVEEADDFHERVFRGRADADADAGEVLAVALGEAGDDGGAKPGGGWAGSGAVVGEGGEGVEAEGVTAEAEVEELGGGLVEGEGVEVVEREGEGRWVGVGFRCF